MNARCTYVRAFRLKLLNRFYWIILFSSFAYFIRVMQICILLLKQGLGKSDEAIRFLVALAKPDQWADSSFELFTLKNCGAEICCVMNSAQIFAISSISCIQYLTNSISYYQFLFPLKTLYTLQQGNWIRPEFATVYLHLVFFYNLIFEGCSQI